MVSADAFAYSVTYVSILCFVCFVGGWWIGGMSAEVRYLRDTRKRANAAQTRG